MEVSDIDLNVDNYSLEEILKVFKIERINFDEEDLVNAKKITLKMHPDKSKLPSEYFLFFSRAYKTIYKIWEIRNKKANKQSTQYDGSLYYEQDKKKVIDKLFSPDKTKEFNHWFNQEFERNRSTNKDFGYGDWLKDSADSTETKKAENMTEMHAEIVERKNKLHSLITHKGIQELEFGRCGGTALSSKEPDNYDSGLFSTLNYQDLKKAHTETVVPVTEQDYLNVKKFNNANDAIFYRKSEETTYKMKGEQELATKHYQEETEAVKTYYDLVKQSEQAEQKNKQLWANLLRITP